MGGEAGPWPPGVTGLVFSADGLRGGVAARAWRPAGVCFGGALCGFESKCGAELLLILLCSSHVPTRHVPSCSGPASPVTGRLQHLLGLRTAFLQGRLLF